MERLREIEGDEISRFPMRPGGTGKGRSLGRSAINGRDREREGRAVVRKEKARGPLILLKS